MHEKSNHDEAKKRFIKGMRIKKHGTVYTMRVSLTAKNARRLKKHLFTKIRKTPGLGFLDVNQMTPKMALNMVITKGLDAMQAEIDAMYDGRPRRNDGEN